MTLFATLEAPTVSWVVEVETIGDVSAAVAETEHAGAVVPCDPELTAIERAVLQ